HQPERLLELFFVRHRSGWRGPRRFQRFKTCIEVVNPALEAIDLAEKRRALISRDTADSLAIPFHATGNFTALPIETQEAISRALDLEPGFLSLRNRRQQQPEGCGHRQGSAHASPPFHASSHFSCAHHDPFQPERKLHFSACMMWRRFPAGASPTIAMPCQDSSTRFARKSCGPKRLARAGSAERRSTSATATSISRQPRRSARPPRGIFPARKGWCWPRS